MTQQHVDQPAAGAAASGAQAAMQPAARARLLEFVARHRKLMVLTGAGCSTAAGIPAYRDRSGEWAHPAPVQLSEFLASRAVRQRYWARSYSGWPRFAAAAPASAHRALPALERAGRITALVTQNVDGLHRRAGSEAVIDLHGCLDTVVCLRCARRGPRAALQRTLGAMNPGWRAAPGPRRPDGDVELEAGASARFAYPDCDECGGILKPDVVFFGESVPRERVQAAFAALEAADALLVAGSSLMVWSGYRFVRRAVATGREVLILNLGRTRADADPIIKIEAECGAALELLAAQVAGGA